MLRETLATRTAGAAGAAVFQGLPAVRSLRRIVYRLSCVGYLFGVVYMHAKAG